MIEVETEELESDGQEPVAVESEYTRSELSAEEFDRELIRRISEAEDLSAEHVASRGSILINMNNLHVGPEDFSDE